MKNSSINLILVGVGILFGVVFVEAASSILHSKRSGVEFENLNDFRAALKSDKAGKLTGDGISVNLAGIVNPNPRDDIIYELKPNLSVTFTGVPVTTNSLGLRGPETTIEKPEGVFRIAILGDSFAFGWGVRVEEAFPAVIERELQKAVGTSKRIEVLNFGVPGYSTFQEAAVFEEKGIKFKPDAVLVFFIHNDFDLPFFIRDLSRPSGLVESFSIGRLASTFMHPNRMQDLMNERGWDPNMALAHLGTLATANNFKLYVTINPRKDYGDCKKRLPVLRHNPAVNFLDIEPQFREIESREHYTDSDLNLPKDIHPTPLRHRIYGELISAQLKTALGW